MPILKKFKKFKNKSMKQTSGVLNEHCHLYVILGYC